jgi:hypothetical protein
MKRMFEAALARLYSLEPRVHVRAYVRYRLGRLEHVCKHTRRWPERQLALPLH